jgi:hypothetical protein
MCGWRRRAGVDLHMEGMRGLVDGRGEPESRGALQALGRATPGTAAQTAPGAASASSAQEMASWCLYMAQADTTGVTGCNQRRLASKSCGLGSGSVYWVTGTRQWPCIGTVQLRLWV